MVKYYTADYVLPVDNDPIKDGIIGVDDEGEIVHLLTADAAKQIKKPIKHFNGIITPGFVNSHCHLELSHLKGYVKQRTGLVSFLQHVIDKRAHSEGLILEAMERADQEMQRNGIVAVGDVSNNLLSRKVKLESKLYYHTYIEIICFEPDKAQDVFRNSLAICDAFSPLSTSVTPHAPYSVCKEIFRYIKQIDKKATNLISIHNQESEEENKFFRYKTGAFVDFYKGLNRNIDFFKGQARNSIQSIVPLLPKQKPVLFVHNTYTNVKDIYFTNRFGTDAYWCFCPNTNLYIEGRLPKIDLFIGKGFPITLGTDSLASNNKLCILSELITLHQHYPLLKLEDTIKWATLEGARYLGIEHQFGSLTVGKRPGLNLLTGTKGLQLTEDTKVKPLI